MQQQYYVNRPQEVYRKQAIMTASPLELIVMLYDGCRKNLLLAKKAIEKDNPCEAHKQLIKAQDVIAELANCLDMRYDISQQLFDIYEFVLRRLGEINMSKDAEAIVPILEIVDSLRTAWQEITDKQQKGVLSLEE